MFNLRSSLYLKLIFTISLIAIIVAYFIEYALGYQPCNLCLLERIPYGLSIILISIIFIKGLDGVSAQTNLVRSVTISSQLTLVSKST